MTNAATPGTAVIKAYYAATALFLLLDYGFGVNVRLAFLDAWPAWRAAYYGFCFACLGLSVWRPTLATPVTTVESLVALIALILSMGARIFSMPALVLESGGGYITGEEIVNFVIAGGAAWYGWHNGSEQLRRDWRR